MDEDNFSKKAYMDNNNEINSMASPKNPISLSKTENESSTNLLFYTNGVVSKEDYYNNYSFVCKFCARRYSSITGLNYHEANFNHTRPPPNYDPHRISKRGRPRGYRPPNKYRVLRNKPDNSNLINNNDYTSRSGRRVSSSTGVRSRKNSHVNVKKLTYAESKRLVEIEQNNKYYRISVDDTLEMIKDETIQEHNSSFQNRNGASKRLDLLPIAKFSIKDEYDGLLLTHKQTSVKPTYFRPLENIEDVSMDRIEYEIDEEDLAWLELVKKYKNMSGLDSSSFEYIMDKFEKESEFILKNTDGSNPKNEEEDVVCAVCLDGDCSNNNLIVFCDICNMAVHQDCYGLPYVPEGQWLCRRCSHAPSKEISCILCSIKCGVFKQTVDGGWCHIICAIMIPGAKFINSVFLEPIDISDISPTRFNVRCKLCNEANGAVIQCVHNHCTVAFHASCAQTAGLLYIERSEAQAGEENVVSQVNHRYLPFCFKHFPTHKNNPKKCFKKLPQKYINPNSISVNKNVSTLSTIHVPVVSDCLVQRVASKINCENSLELVLLVKRFWQIKRYLRSGVPLLRRRSYFPKNLVTSFKIDDKQIKKKEDLEETVNHLTLLKDHLKGFLNLLTTIQKREDLKHKRDTCELKLYTCALNFNDFFDKILDHLNKITKKSIDKCNIERDSLKIIIQNEFNISNLTNIQQLTDFLIHIFNQYFINNDIPIKQQNIIISTLKYFVVNHPSICKNGSKTDYFLSSCVDITPSNIDTDQLVKDLTQDLSDCSEDSSISDELIVPPLKSIVWAPLGKVKYFPARVIDLEYETSNNNKKANKNENIIGVNVMFLNNEQVTKWVTRNDISLLGVSAKVDKERLIHVLNSKSYNRNVKKNFLTTYTK
ncbi:hypothetical protein HZS_2857, partial [Henneguya salminicola]